MITVHISSGVTLPFLPKLSDRAAWFKLEATHTVPIGQFIAIPRPEEVAVEAGDLE